MVCHRWTHDRTDYNFFDEQHILQSFVFLSFIIVDGQISNKCDKLMDNTDTVDIYVYIHIYVSVYVEKNFLIYV